MTPQEKANKILLITCNYHKLTVNEIKNQTRKGKIVRARQQAMNLMWFNSGLTDSQISEIFGKERTTVVHAKKRVKTDCLSVKYCIKFKELESIVFSEVGKGKYTMQFPGNFSI
jgi:chromosomal replication initiation ATPase DnaA